MSNTAILPQIQPITNPRMKNISGHRFERLVAIGYVGTGSGGKALWLCQCDCGTNFVTEGKSLRTNNTRSCGCLQRDITGDSRRSHGMSETRIYSIWCNMRTRCQNPNSERYPDYGGRGIEICKRWQSFQDFYADMGDPPSKTHTLDRIDNDGNYCPENCRWATPSEQNSNTKANHVIEYDGKKMTITQWGKYVGIKYITIFARIDRLGWSVERALTTPAKK